MRLAAALLLTIACQAQTVHIGVFGLFHPKELEVRPSRGGVLMVGERRLAWPSRMVIDAPVRVAGVNGEATEMVLAVPGRITRRFIGRLEVARDGAELVPVLEMDREAAVAAIVAAESPPGAPLEALKAQAVVARSYLSAARTRHQGFDFCDTTHCQFLREAPARGSKADRAAAETRGLVVKYGDAVVEALYSANCGGRTRTLADARLKADGGYPYFAVDCPVRGVASGHRVGLCQRGAAAMSSDGVDFRGIIARYFPGVVVE